MLIIAIPVIHTGVADEVCLRLVCSHNAAICMQALQEETDVDGAGAGSPVDVDLPGTAGLAGFKNPEADAYPDSTRPHKPTQQVSIPPTVLETLAALTMMALQKQRLCRGEPASLTWHASLCVYMCGLRRGSGIAVVTGYIGKQSATAVLQSPRCFELHEYWAHNPFTGWMCCCKPPLCHLSQGSHGYC